MTEVQFAAMAKLLRLRQGPAQEAVRLHLVQGLGVPDAAREVGMEYQAAHQAVKRAKEGLDLVKQASG